MILEGIFYYQTLYDDTVHYKEFDNSFKFKNGIVTENGFLKKSDSYFSVLLGGCDKQSQKKSFASNIIFKGDLSNTPLKDFILDPLEVKPKVGAWYDENSQTTYLIRDLFGSIPLFYIHIPEKFVVFSTSFTSLLEIEDVKSYLQINVNKIGGYLLEEFESPFTTVDETFLTNIKSVLPGHLLTITPTESSSVPFESFRPERWELISDSYSKVIREVMIKNISIASGSLSEHVGSHLSGGLDSSSISSTFKHLYPERELKTFHIRANNNETDETEFAVLVSNNISSHHHWISQSEEDLKLLEFSISLYGQPESSFLSPASNVAAIDYAKKEGCDILMNGHGGDSVIGSGMELLGEAFQQRNWTELQVLLEDRVKYFSLRKKYRNWDKYSSKKKYHLVLQNYLYGKISIIRKLPIDKILSLCLEINKNLGISLPYFFTRAFTSFFYRLTKKNVKTTTSILKNEILDSLIRKKIPSSHSAYLAGNLPNKFQAVFQDVFHENAIRSQEQHFMLGNNFGVSIRSPYMNKELLELCLAIPDKVKFGDGIGRAHLRDAMKGILTDEVRTRSSKTTLSSDDGEAMTLRLFKQATWYLEPTREIWKYVDAKKFDTQIDILNNRKVPYSQKSKTYFHITRTISLSIWLEWLSQKNIISKK